MAEIVEPAPVPLRLEPTYEYEAAVVRVVDGDTVIVDIHKDVGFGIVVHIRQNVRLLGIDAPEVVGKDRAAGLASKALLAALLPKGQVIQVRTHKPNPRDKYGRFLAEIWKDGENLNEHMVVAGAASRYP